jgi:cyclophilin family peptidyl-prolyl cis-trans isomerase
VLARLADAYPEHVQIVYRHFPLNSIHDNAQKAAEASEAAGAQGEFWAYHDLLFEKASEWSSLGQDGAHGYFVGLAEELGLDADKFAQELEDGVYTDYVSGLEQEAVNIGLTGTPQGIINGGLVQRLPPDYQMWANAVEEMINNEDAIREAEATREKVMEEIEAAMQELEAMQYGAPPEMTLKDDAEYTARVIMENGDEFVIELYPESAPLTVNNFIFLAREGWYDGVTFHRVLPGFVAQTGDPTGTGMGGPGYTIPNEIDPELSHAEKGMVAMANSGADTNGSQWYITYDDVSQLDGNYTIFGKVIEGMDVVEEITPRDPQSDPSAAPGDVIQSIVIEETTP